MVYTSGVRSDGNYRQDGFEPERQLESNERETIYHEGDRRPPPYRDERCEGAGLLDGLGNIFRRLKTDDLLLIGLGLVLLLDGNKDNDLLIVVLLLLLFD